MCTRTKTTYGCGCRHKSTDECHSPSSTCITRFHFAKEYDCDECRRGGDRVTRGREGKGRYARELKLSNATSLVTRPPLSPISTNIKASPWAPEPPRPREKEWRSPVRRKADDAWLVEHEQRERDLEAKSQKSLSGGSVSSPTTNYTRDHRRRDENLADKVRRLEEEVERLRVRRRQEWSNSYDSFHTMDSSCSPPRGRSFDSGFHVLPSSYIPKVSSHHRLGRGLGDIIKDSTRPRSRW